MGMTIKEALKIVKDGRIVAIAIRGNNEDETKFNQENIEALNVIVATMHKCQKIQEIIKDWEDERFSDLVGCLRVREVLKNV